MLRILVIDATFCLSIKSLFTFLIKKSFHVLFAFSSHLLLFYWYLYRYRYWTYKRFYFLSSYHIFGRHQRFFFLLLTCLWVLFFSSLLLIQLVFAVLSKQLTVSFGSRLVRIFSHLIMPLLTSILMPDEVFHAHHFFTDWALLRFYTTGLFMEL